MSRWISVSEGLPAESGKFIVCSKNGSVYQTKFYAYPESKGGHWGQKDKGKNITHWMPLPKAPTSQPIETADDIEARQIMEMADDVRRIRESYYGKADYLFAKKLFEDGYRKQSEKQEEVWVKPSQCSEPVCSRCGKCPKMVFGMLPPYCPHCGKKMKGADHE